MSVPDDGRTMPRHVEIAVLLALVGVALLLNPLYLYPDGGGPERTYEAEQIEGESAASDALSRSDDALVCPHERACRLEREVLERGGLEYDGRAREGPRYDVVQLDGRWYLPRAESSGENVTLDLRSVDALAAVEHVAVPASDRSPAVVDVVESGSTTVHGGALEPASRGEIVRHDGQHYAVVERQYRDHWTAGDYVLPFARIALVVFGGAALLVAGVLLRADAARSASETEQ